MITAKYMPVVSANEIENELIAKGVSSKYAYNVRQMLFDDRYVNDVYVSYRIVEDVCADDYTDKEEAMAVQEIIDMLREVYPDAEYVLVDVSW